MDLFSARGALDPCLNRSSAQFRRAPFVSHAMKPVITALLCGLLLSSTAQAATPEALRELAERFLRERAQGIAGQVNISVATPSPRNPLANCKQPEAFVPAAQKNWGHITVGLRCSETPAASLYLSASVSVIGSYVVMARPVAGGQAIGIDDVRLVEGELSSLPGDILTQLDRVIGRHARQALNSGQSLRSVYLLATVNVRAGQEVKVIARGKGFTVANGGRALNTAMQGEVTRVRLDNGRVIVGVLGADGIVEVAE